MKLNGKLIKTILFRTIEICVWIFCFYLIQYLVVNYLYPTRPITSDMSPVSRSIAKHNNTGILSKQSFYTSYFRVTLCWFIVGYYAILQVIRHKKKSRIKNDNEKIAEQRKIICYRLLVIMAFSLFIIFIIILFGNDKLFAFSLIGWIFSLVSFMPLYLYYGLSKVYSFTFALKVFGFLLLFFLIGGVLFRIQPVLAGILASALPICGIYTNKINVMSETFFKNLKFKKQQTNNRT